MYVLRNMHVVLLDNVMYVRVVHVACALSRS